MPHPTDIQRPGHPGGQTTSEFAPRLIAWEVTRRCLLSCKHCRASAQNVACADELSTAECFALLDNIASFAKPIIILTGGEPMLRDDIYDIAKYGVKLGLPVVMAPCGLLVNDETAGRIKDAGIRRISLSLDGADAATHDDFRGMKGSFDAVMNAVAAARRAGLDFQINTTISRHNVDQVRRIMDLSIKLGASVFNPFLLVPTGRGKQLADQELSAGQYEQALQWLAAQQGRGDIQVRVTCAPHYQRILRQSGKGKFASRGCMGGKQFAFISHTGKVQICGFLDTECGDLRADKLDFHRVWRTSPVFLQMRDVNGYHGRCGRCEFRVVCGGCRARAFATTGDYLAEEPFCVYQPGRSAATESPVRSHAHAPEDGLQHGHTPGGEANPQSAIRDPQSAGRPAGSLDFLDRKILTLIQADFPVVQRPFAELSNQAGVPEGKVLARVRRLAQSGRIRRIGAIFDSGKLGYVSTLVAATVAQDRVDEVAAMVSALPGVTHNYRRDHRYNLWFTLTCESGERLQQTLDGLSQQTGVAFHSLPALAMYKARVQFDLMDESPASSPAPQAAADATQRDGSDRLRSDDAPGGNPAPVFEDRAKALIRVLQESIPLSAEPYAAIASQLGMDVAQVLAQVSDWIGSGVIRRMGAVVAHRKLGFSANGMAVFAIGDERADEVGRHLAACPQVTHCYRRSALPGWPYTMFAMIHSTDEQEVRRFVAAQAAALGLTDYDVLFSTHEYKKVSMRYFTTTGHP